MLQLTEETCQLRSDQQEQVLELEAELQRRSSGQTSNPQEDLTECRRNSCEDVQQYVQGGLKALEDRCCHSHRMLWVHENTPFKNIYSWFFLNYRIWVNKILIKYGHQGQWKFLILKQLLFKLCKPLKYCIYPLLCHSCSVYIDTVMTNWTWYIARLDTSPFWRHCWREKRQRLVPWWKPKSSPRSWGSRSNLLGRRFRNWSWRGPVWRRDSNWPTCRGRRMQVATR